MSELAKAYWKRVFTEVLESRPNGIVIRRDPRYPSFYYATGAENKAVLWSCHRIAEHLELPPKHQLTDEDYNEVLVDLGLTIPNLEIEEKLEAKNNPIIAKTGLAPGSPEQMAGWREGTSGYLRCTVRSVKRFRQAAMKDTVLGEASLAKAKELRARLRYLAIQQGLYS